MCGGPWRNSVYEIVYYDAVPIACSKKCTNASGGVFTFENIVDS